MCSIPAVRPAAVLLCLAFACKRDGDYVVHRANGRIEIDGVLAESSWDRAARAGPFVRSLDGKTASAATEARLLWDDDHLYVAFLSEDTNVASPFVNDDDKLYTSNVVEIFLNPSGDSSRYDEIEVAPTNALFDASFSGGPRKGMDLSWSSHARHAVRVDGTLNAPGDVDRGWTVELAIPWTGLAQLARPDGRSLPPKDGDVWRMDFTRFNQYKEAPPSEAPGGWAWSPHGEWDSHIPEVFPHVRFSTRAVRDPKPSSP